MFNRRRHRRCRLLVALAAALLDPTRPDVDDAVAGTRSAVETDDLVCDDGDPCTYDEPIDPRECLHARRQCFAAVTCAFAGGIEPPACAADRAHLVGRIRALVEAGLERATVAEAHAAGCRLARARRAVKKAVRKFRRAGRIVARARLSPACADAFGPMIDTARTAARRLTDAVPVCMPLCSGEPPACREDLCPSGRGPGRDQQCCVVDPGGGPLTIPCFAPPAIARTGRGSAPLPMWPDPGYPKVADDVVLAGAFCVDAPPGTVIQVAGSLPAPAAVLLPGRIRYVGDAMECPANPAQGPNLLEFTVGAGGDADIGWQVVGHNQQLAVEGARLRACLEGCDEGSVAACHGAGATGAGSLNASLFGAPVPVATGGSPVCVTAEFAGAVTVARADLESGQVDLAVPLVLGVHQAVSPAAPCPTCSGGDAGVAGVCAGGANAGQACVTDAVSDLGALSRQCPPAPATRVGDFPLDLDVTTGTRELTATLPCRSGRGPCWCAGQLEANQCAAARN
jgi:hypothetical protein